MGLTLEPKAFGSVYQWDVTVKRNGEVWDLSGGTVELRFKPPTGAVKSFTAQAVDPVLGSFVYTNATSLIDEVGWWSLNVKVTSGTVIQEMAKTFIFLAIDPP